MIYNGLAICLPFQYKDIYISEETSFVLIGRDVLYDHDENKLIGLIKNIYLEKNCLFCVLELDETSLEKHGISCSNFSCNYKHVGLSIGGWYDKEKRIFYIEEISVTSIPAEEKTLGSGVFIKLSKKKHEYNINTDMTPQEIIQVITEIRDLLVQHEQKISSLETKVAEIEKIVLEIKDAMLMNQKTSSEMEVVLSKYKDRLDDILAQGMDILKTTIETLKNNR